MHIPITLDYDYGVRVFNTQQVATVTYDVTYRTVEISMSSGATFMLGGQQAVEFWEAFSKSELKP